MEGAEIPLVAVAGAGLLFASAFAVSFFDLDSLAFAVPLALARFIFVSLPLFDGCGDRHMMLYRRLQDRQGCLCFVELPYELCYCLGEEVWCGCCVAGWLVVAFAGL